ncbi:hypothetical protein C8J55DRAFT_494445 [Lentinula edodes]|uniref:Uncharacterized protein n=1 Tax=Lentinula lateritia TaxID=40482 RepID=A0A9W9DD73_9AGAR|nr:hypothetical protein C8J55DRAFT_494445 [Lentinula edodes]
MTVEEVTDNGDSSPGMSRNQFVSVNFSGAGAELEGETWKNGFQQFKDTKQEKSEEMWSPFKSRKEWQLARWLMLSGVSHGDIDSFAKLSIIQDELHSSFKDKCTFLKKIDALPTVRGGWICKELEIVGNIMKKAADGTEVPMTEGVELWRRDPIECIKELMEDPRLPLCNIFHCITPDILHQLHKGVFKDHIVRWSTRAVTGKSKKEREREIDIWFQSMPRHPTLRHFKCYFWCHQSEEIILCVRAILDFIEYSQFSLHTDESLEKMDEALRLEKMDEALRSFHSHKDAAFVDTGIRQAFNIPKVHSMKYYTPMTLSIGAAPGYNTEWSERLHIDFAKLAYRASNRRDYIKQMTRWLDRREKVLWFTRFLDWALEKDRIDWLATREVDEEENKEAVTIPEFGEALQVEGIRTNLQYGESTCMVAKRTPVTNITIESLDSDFGCSTFVYAMERFLCEQNLLQSDYWDAQPAKYSLYKQFWVIVLPTLEFSNSSIVDVVHATAAQPAVLSGRGKRKYTPAQFETVLARKSLPDSQEDLDVLGKDGLHVAQVHAIFDLPSQLGSFPHPLAYVEWFTPLRKLDKVTQMYRVERSMRGKIHNSSIIPITYIACSCHLVPFYGKHADPSWSSEKVLDQCQHFYLNPYLRPIDFVLLRPKDNN